MRLADLILLTRHQINDQAAKFNSDSEVALWLNQCQRDLFRRKVEADPSFGRMSVSFAAGDVERVRQTPDRSWWRYYLPSWALKVRGVFKTTSETDRVEVSSNDWRFSSNRSVDVRCGGSAWAISVDVAKVPALMRAGTVAVNSTSRSELIIPKEAGVDAAGKPYQSEYEAGCLLEAQVELIQSDAVRGVVATVVSQAPDVIDNQAVWRLEVFPAYDDMPTSTDKFEIHSEIEDVHCNYLALMAAEALLARNSNAVALELLRPRLAHCERRFVAGLQPRTNGIPRFIETLDEYGGMSSSDPDVDLSMGQY